MPGDNIAEDIVDSVLQELKKEKIISAFIRSKKYGELDVAGIDFLIILNSGYSVPIQCKTLSKKIGEKIADHKEKHGEIRFVVCVRTHGFKRNKKALYLLARKDLLALISGGI